MKKLTYIVIIMSFLALFSGCSEGGSGTDAQTPVPTQTSTSLAPQLVVEPVINEISLRWNTVDEELGYLLEWSAGTNTLNNTINIPTGATSYVHENLESNTIHYYRLTAKLKDEQLGESSEIIAVKTGDSAKFIQSDIGI